MAHDDDDLLVAKSSHPVTTTLLLIGCAALIAAITLTTKQLGIYVNPATRKQLKDYKITAVKLAEMEMPKAPGSAKKGGLTPEQDY